MQHQGNLTTLATARLLLFQTFTLPSILQQTSQKFMWFIKVDPNLDQTIMNNLISIITKDHGYNGHIYVISSNKNFLIGHDSGAWRGGVESEEIITKTSHGVHTGNIQLLQRAQLLEPQRIILETRLDADDGLHKRFLEYIQMDAMETFFLHTTEKESNEQISNASKSYIQSPNWFYWCTGIHLKWYLNVEEEFGNVDTVKNTEFCITTGLTVGFNVGTNATDIPTYGHHELYTHLADSKSCGGPMYDQQCIGFVTEFIAAVRSRTLTSAGMSDVNYGIGQNTKTAIGDNGKSDELLWKILRNRFQVSMEKLDVVKKYFIKNMQTIAKENLEGQCRGEHSCKKSSRIKLENLSGMRKELQ